MYKFGKTSLERLKTCHEDLKLILHRAIRRSSVDFGIAEGHRSLERQKQLFNEGKSRIDGITKKGKHNYTPSLAVDIYAYYNGKSQWDSLHLSYLAGLIESVSNELYEEGLITHRVRWGGNWDSDGVIVIDQSFNDLPHFELV